MGELLDCRKHFVGIACILDPRCKMVVVEYYLKEMYPVEYEGFLATIKACINELFKEYSDEQSKLVQNQASSSAQTSRPATGAAAPVNVSESRSALKDFMREKKVCALTKSEIEEYLAEPLDESAIEDVFDILAWWKLKAGKYPILSRLVRDVLAVPVSTVASEVTFSTSGRTLNPVSSLNDESIEALVCAQDWLRAVVIVQITKNGLELGDPLWPSDEETVVGGASANGDSAVPATP